MLNQNWRTQPNATEEILQPMTGTGNLISLKNITKSKTGKVIMRGESRMIYFQNKRVVYYSVEINVKGPLKQNGIKHDLS